MAFTLYDELATRKQIVLGRGDFSHHLSKPVRCVPPIASHPGLALPCLIPAVVQEAAHLVDLLKHYYLTEWRTVETFNTTPGEFDFQRFMDQCPRKENTKPRSKVV